MIYLLRGKNYAFLCFCAVGMSVWESKSVYVLNSGGDMIACGLCPIPLPPQEPRPATAHTSCFDASITHTSTPKHPHWGCLLLQSESNTVTSKLVLRDMKEMTVSEMLEKKRISSWDTDIQIGVSGRMLNQKTDTVSVRARHPQAARVDVVAVCRKPDKDAKWQCRPWWRDTTGKTNQLLWESTQHGPNLSLAVRAELWAQKPCIGYK